VKELGKEWKIYDTHFDNIFGAMITLFIVSSLEGWPDIMALAIDSDEDTAVKLVSFFFLRKFNKFFLKK
jgi:hypothetical protein